MNYLAFHGRLKEFPAFSVTDIRKLGDPVYPHRLADWQKKGYIKRVANGVYVFGNSLPKDNELMQLANKLYKPSYISLETALSFHGFIPEAVYAVTSVTTRKTSRFEADGTVFIYRTVKPEMFLGYNLLPLKGPALLIASPAKALIDYFYLHPELNNEDAISELRLNSEQVKAKTDIQELNQMLGYINNRKLTQRMTLLKGMMNLD